MTKERIEPLTLKIPLASQSLSAPMFAVDLTLKGKKIQATDPQANRAMIALMDMEAQLGGAASHFGGPAAFAELMSATHALMFEEAKSKDVHWYDLFNFVNDAGHCENGLYALKANYGYAGLNIEKLKTFRSMNSPLTGHGEVHLFPQAIWISNGPLGSGLPQAQGLAFGDYLAEKQRLTVTALSDGACMEGEAREALAAIPGLAANGKLAPFVCIISDNNTKLSGRIDEESYSMQPTFHSLSVLGWKVIELKEAHDLQKCLEVVSQAFEEARQNPKRPIAIHAKTVKGQGNAKAVKSSTGGHGFPLKTAGELTEFINEIYSGKTIPQEFSQWIEELHEKEKSIQAKKIQSSEKREKVQTGVAQAMIEAARKGLPVFSLSSDLSGSTGVKAFQSEFPELTQDIGVAEANMVSMAAGLSKCGYIPFVDTFAQFGVTKGALPFIMAQLSEAPLLAVFSHTGFQDAADGASHQAITYFSMLAAIPNIDVYALTCKEEAYQIVLKSIEKFADDRKSGRIPRTTVFFLGRENFALTYGANSYELKKHQLIEEVKSVGTGNSVTLVAAGSMLDEAVKACQILREAKVEVQVINPSILNLVDLEFFKTQLAKTGGRVVTVEDHRVDGGYGAFLCHSLMLGGVPHEMASLGVNEQFGQSAYEAIDLYRAHAMDSESIVKAALNLISASNRKAK